MTQALDELGIIPTVYSLVYPETRALFDELRTTPALGDMYERAWTKHQDPMHDVLFERWCEWSSPVLRVDWHDFPHRYVSAGSSEAIRDSVAAHVADSRARGQEPRIHVFDGEYEGFAAFAAAYRCQVVRHDRQRYAESMAAHVRPGDRFFVSAPSSIDGMVWGALEEFAAHTVREHPQLRLAVDLCYVGCVGSGPYAIDLTSPNIDTVFFSLSKVFGVYYHRIGGVFSRAPRPGLHGNVWFKNLLSIRFGTALLERYAVSELPQRYRPVQERLVEQAREIVGEPLAPADVVLLAHHPGRSGRAAIDETFTRANGLRFCLTPGLDRALKGPP